MRTPVCPSLERTENLLTQIREDDLARFGNHRYRNLKGISPHVMHSLLAALITSMKGRRLLVDAIAELLSDRKTPIHLFGRHAYFLARSWHYLSRPPEKKQRPSELRLKPACQCRRHHPRNRVSEAVL